MMDVLSDFGSLAVPILVFLGLIVLAGIVVWLGRRARRHRSHGLVAGHRLAVVDQVQIDEHRRLVLIQRDDVQHLVVLGGGSDFLVESGIGDVRARDAQHSPAMAHAVEPPRVPEAPRPAAPAPAPDSFRAAEPPREPMRSARDLVPPAPAVPPRPARPIPLPSEARAPVDPRPTTYSRGPARDLTVEPMPIAPGAAGPFPTRRSAEARPAEPESPVRPAPVPPAVAHRAEPVIEPPMTPDTGARVSVKVDPLFADMADQLEETLRRPTTPESDPARRPVPAAPQSFERPVERPAATPLRGGEGWAADEPRVAPAAPIVPAPPVAAPVVSAPASTLPAAGPAAVAPASRAPIRETDRPDMRAADLPVLDIRPEPRPSETRIAETPAPEIRAIDLFAPSIRAPEARAPEIDITEERPSASAEPGDPFEEEMASLLGRSRRP